MISHSKILGLSIGTKSFFLAELVAKAKDGRPAITNLAEFTFPGELSLATPVELGQALAAFLRTEKFSAHDLVIGLPARRLVTRRKDVPPAPAALAASTLRLQAESDFSSATGSSGEADAFVIDFAGQTSSSDPSSVLLIATAQSCIDQCQQLAKAAGLRLRGITASAAALAHATSALASQPFADGLVLSLACGSAELVVQRGSAPSQLRHLAIPNAGAPESLPALAGEIRRTVASLQHNGSPLSLALWDDSSANSAPLEGRLGMPVTTPELRDLAQNQAPAPHSPGAAASNANAYAPAVAVALAALSRPGKGGGLPVDFLHSRLAPPRESRHKRPLAIAIYAGSLIVLVILLCVLDIYLKQSHLNSLNSQSAQHAGQVKTAQAAADRLAVVNRWVRRPAQFVPCLHDLTNLVPDRGETIWATGLSLSSDPNNKDVLTGQAVDIQEIKDLAHKMLDSKQFLDPRPTYPGTRTTSGAPEIAFSIKFTYKPPEPHK